MSTTTTISTFKQLIRHNDLYTDRDLMQIMKVSYTTLKERERDPAKLSMEQLFRLAAHLEQPLEYILSLILAEVQERVQRETDALRATTEQLGRKNKRKGAAPEPAPAKRRGRPVGSTRQATATSKQSPTV